MDNSPQYEGEKSQPFVQSKPRVFFKNERAKLNISGTRFEVRWSTLLKFPQTRLGRLATTVCEDSVGRVSSLCDAYESSTNEFFFERDPTAFPSVLNYYITMNLHIPRSDCVKTFEEEVNYWAIPFDMGPCCDSYYFDEWECTEAMKKTDMLENTLKLKKAEKKPENKNKWHLMKANLWNLFENPETSLTAKIISVASNLVVILSTVILCVNTHPKVQVLLSDGTKGDNPYLTIIEKVCVVWFTIEYIIRLVSCPDKKRFLKGAQNAVDFLAIFPFYIGLFIELGSGGISSNFQNIRRFVQILRIIRIVRIFKLARHSTGLQVLAYTVKESSEELGLLVLLLMMGMTLFSTLVYYAEENVPGTKFKSIMEGFWWAIITMTTVGYGDTYPETTYGKIVGCMCCISGILFIALPIPTIVGNFSKYYREHRSKAKMESKKTNESSDSDFDPFYMMGVERARRVSLYHHRRSTIRPISERAETMFA